MKNVRREVTPHVSTLFCQMAAPIGIGLGPYFGRVPGPHIPSESRTSAAPRRDAQNSRFAEDAMPLNLLTGDVHADSRRCGAGQRPSRPRHIGNRGPGHCRRKRPGPPETGACIETSASRINGLEADPAGAAQGFRSDFPKPTGMAKFDPPN